MSFYIFIERKLSPRICFSSLIKYFYKAYIRAAEKSPSLTVNLKTKVSDKNVPPSLLTRPNSSILDHPITSHPPSFFLMLSSSDYHHSWLFMQRRTQECIFYLFYMEKWEKLDFQVDPGFQPAYVLDPSFEKFLSV